MNRLIIICEGQAEQEFSDKILYDYFLTKNIIIYSPTIKKSKGGIVKWENLKNEINIYLKNDTTVYVTIFIDYYGIGFNKGYPNNRKVENVNERRDVIKEMLEGMQNEIDENHRHRFIPYIQLHEFESLIFSNTNVLYDIYDEKDFKDVDFLNKTNRDYNDPELINDSEQTAPSKRLQRIIPIYNKTEVGKLILEEIGLENLKIKCKGFNNWILDLEEKCKFS